VRKIIWFVFGTWYGALVCWCANTATLLLLVAFVDGGRTFWKVVDAGEICGNVFAGIVLLVLVIFLFRRKWRWAAGLFLCVSVIGLVSEVGMDICELHRSSSGMSERVRPWVGSEIFEQIPFSIEFQPTHPFLAEYNRRIRFRSGKCVDIDMDTGGRGAFVVYSLGTNGFYIVDSMDRKPDSIECNKYRIDVESETVESQYVLGEVTRPMKRIGLVTPSAKVVLGGH